MFKKAAAVLLALVLSIVSLGCLTVNAAESVPDVSPTYEYAGSYTSTLTITGTTAKCVSYSIGNSGVTSIVVNQTLQRKTSSGTWQFVEHWNETDTGTRSSTTNYKYNLSSGTYRLKSQFTFLSDEGFETVSVYSEEKTV